MLLKYKIGCKRKRFVEMVGGYIIIILASIIFVFLYVFPSIGLPELISIFRLSSTIQMLIWGVIWIPVDVLLFLTSSRLEKDVIRAETVINCIVIYCSAFLFNFHGFLCCELTRYNAAVAVTQNILEKYPRYSYTIVATTDELYQVIEDGRHEELLTFVENIDKEEFYLPTEYIFLYIEKHPLKHAQYHYYSGSHWLARERWKESEEDISQCPYILHTNISKEAAEKVIPDFKRPYMNYRDLESRTILESQAYYWFQEFSKLYPVETSVYYEDDDFVCYCIHQSAESQINLALSEG